MKIIRFLAVLLLTVLLFAITVSAERRLPLVVDGAKILAASEEHMLLAELKALTQDLSCEIAVVTVSSLGGKHVQDYADDYYDDNGYGYGSGDHGVLLLLAINEREWAITLHGAAKYALSDQALYYIEERMLPDLRRGDYYEAFLTFAEGCSRYVRHYLAPDEGDKDDPWISFVEDSDNDYDGGNSLDWKGTLLVAIGIGVVVSFIVVSVMKSQLTSVRSRHEANAYIRSDGLRLTASRDVFLYRSVTRIRRDTDNDHRAGGGSRSGGFSSHRSSSGRSHGGRSGRF